MPDQQIIHLLSGLAKAHMVSFFLIKKGGSIGRVKLMKLLYLADRQHITNNGSSISGDHYVSMNNGPVLSETYDFMRGRSSFPEWTKLIDTDNAYHWLANPELQLNDLDALAGMEIETLEQTWQKFGQMTRKELIKYTHDHCGEWSDPGNSSWPIAFERILSEVGIESEAIENLASENEIAQTLENSLNLIELLEA